MTQDKFTPDQRSLDQWAAVDRYFSEQLCLSDPILDAVMAANKAAELPAIDVARNQGKLLQLLAKLGRRAKNSRNRYARRLQHHLAGASLARRRPLDHSRIQSEARRNRARQYRKCAGLTQTVEIRVGAALDTLRKLQNESSEPFDLIFIDADKPNNSAYVRWAIKLSRPGTLIVIDNVVRDGALIDAASVDKDVQGARQLFELLANEPRLSCTAIQTVGVKGYDGFAFAIVTSDS